MEARAAVYNAYLDAPTDVPAGIGVFEGEVLSPRIFSLLMGPLARRLRRQE